MEIKIDCKLLSEQIQLLEMYASVMTNEHNKELVYGISNLLSDILFVVEEDVDVNITKWEEK